MKQLVELIKAIEFFGNRYRVAKITKVSPSSVDKWLAKKVRFGDNIMNYNRAIMLEESSDGKILTENLVPDFAKAAEKYTELKKKRKN